MFEDIFNLNEMFCWLEVFSATGVVTGSCDCEDVFDTLEWFCATTLKVKFAEMITRITTPIWYELDGLAMFEGNRMRMREWESDKIGIQLN